jgi:hypothetical protein
VKKDGLAALFFGVTAIALAAAAILSDASPAGTAWLVSGIAGGVVSGCRFWRTAPARRAARDQRDPKAERQRVRSVAWFAGGLGAVAQPLLPEKVWMGMYGYGGAASLMCTVFFVRELLRAHASPVGR